MAPRGRGRRRRKPTGSYRRAAPVTHPVHVVGVGFDVVVGVGLKCSPACRWYRPPWIMWYMCGMTQAVMKAWP
jgi:hypothetical protein